MNIVITGGAGFLGKAVSRRLLAAGHSILIYDDLSIGCAPPVPQEGLTYVQGDILDAALLEQTFRSFRPDAVVHLAALHYIPACNARPQQALRINVEGTLSVLLACCNSGSIRGLVFASSGAVYGPDDRWHLEDEPPAPTDIYGLSKLLGEQLVEHYAAEGNFGATALRFANLYGPGETNPHVIPEIVRQIHPGTTLELGRIDTYRDFLYIDDAAQLVHLALEHAIGNASYQVVNAASGKEYSIREILSEMEQLTGHTLSVQTAADRVRRVERNHLRLDPARALALFGARTPYSLREGLRETLSEAGVPVTGKDLVHGGEAR